MSKCALCKQQFEYDEMYEYRGFLSCVEHFDEVIERVDSKRAMVMEAVETSTMSQRKGEFVNNHHKYSRNNVASDGLPIIKIKEPQILKDYEAGEL